MDQDFRHINVEKEGDACIVQFRRSRLSEQEVLELGDEILQLAENENCPRIVFDLLSETPECLFSVFLAKIVSLQKKLEAMGGGLHIANCNPHVVGIFSACCLDRIFKIFESRQEAINAEWAGQAT